MSDEEYEDEEYDEGDEEEEEVTPENCSMGIYSPGTELCEFCPSGDWCRELFEEKWSRRK